MCWTIALVSGNWSEYNRLSDSQQLLLIAIFQLALITWLAITSDGALKPHGIGSHFMPECDNVLLDDLRQKWWESNPKPNCSHNDLCRIHPLCYDPNHCHRLANLSSSELMVARRQLFITTVASLKYEYTDHNKT